jgi:hypothetical protein
MKYNFKENIEAALRNKLGICQLESRSAEIDSNVRFGVSSARSPAKAYIEGNRARGKSATGLPSAPPITTICYLKPQSSTFVVRSAVTRRKNRTAQVWIRSMVGISLR